jgi:vitamin B12 transporter
MQANFLPFRRSLLSAALLVALAPVAHAAEPSTLDDVVVTATRTQTPRAEVLAAVTVLERDDIERAQAADVIELLSRQPGIDVVRTGGPGSVSTFNTRGTNSSHTLILIDGLRVNSSVQGLFDLAHLPLAQVERIEIVRGPRAALWGSDAIGGVVQIFTRDDVSGFVEARGGSYGERSIDAGVRLGSSEAHVGIAAGVEAIEGFSASDYDDDKDGYSNRHVGVRFRVPVGNQVLSGSARGADADVEYDTGNSDVRDWQAGVRLAGELRPGWQHELVVGHSLDEVDSSSPGYDYAFASDRDSVDWLHRFAPAANQVLQFGLNWSRESGSAWNIYDGENYDLDRRNLGAFVAWNGRAGAHAFDLSLRHDDNSQFGGATTGNAAWGWNATDALRLRASWGQGFRAPNFNELYYPGFGGGYYAGFAGLSPERSTSVEAGLDWNVSQAHVLGVSAYRTRVRGLIAFEGIPYNSAVNIDRAELDGVEFDWSLHRGAWSYAANAGWQRAVDGGDGHALLRRAPRKAHASIDYRFASGLLLGVDADAVSARPDTNFDTFPSTPVSLAGYGLVHVRAAWPLPAGWQLEARIQNIGDREYELVHGFNTPDRSGMLSIRWRARAPE